MIDTDNMVAGGLEKHVLVTGGTGFVGRPVVAALVNAGHRVTCVVRPGRKAELDGLSVQFRLCDDVFSQTSDWWADACKDVDTIIHLAWYAEPGKYLTSAKNIDCLTGTLTLAQGAAKAGVRRFVGVGTCFEYDLTGSVQSVETKLAPLTPYAAAKVATFTMLAAYLAQSHIEFLWARLFYLYGAREDPRRLVPYLHAQLGTGKVADLTQGTAVRDFMDVEDAAAMLVRDALSDRQGPANICSGAGVTIRALAESIADTYGRRDLLNFGARPDNLTDPPSVVGVRTQK